VSDKEGDAINAEELRSECGPGDACACMLCECKEFFVGSIAEKIQGADGFNKMKSVLGLKRHDVGQSFRRISFGPNHVSRQRTGKFAEIGWGRRGRGSW